MSYVSDHGREVFPYQEDPYINKPWYPFLPDTNPLPKKWTDMLDKTAKEMVVKPLVKYIEEPTLEQIEAFIELLESAKKFDNVTGQPNCEDPKKTAFLVDLFRKYASLKIV